MFVKTIWFDIYTRKYTATPLIITDILRVVNKFIKGSENRNTNGVN